MDNRAARVRLLRCYMDGNAPLPEGAEGCREAYQAFQKKARTNVGEIIVEAVTERIIPSGFTLNGADEDDDQLRKIFTGNRLQIGFADVLRDMTGLSAGYMMVSEAAPGKALITCERPEQAITDQDPARPDMVRAGLKVYRDAVAETDTAYLHLPGAVHTYKRPFRDPLTQEKRVITRIQGDWAYVDSAETGLNFVPMFPFLNRGGMGEFEPHLDIIDRYNWNVLQRLVITASQAYRQRAVKAIDGQPLPQQDADGNDIDYDKIFAQAPGALWELPPGFDLWESGQTDLSQILNATKDDLRDLAAVTRTPLPMLLPEGANQTAAGAMLAKEGLILKATDRRKRADVALTAALGAAKAIEDGLADIVEGVEVIWEPIERYTLAEISDATSKIGDDLPWRDRMERLWGLSGDAIDKMESNRAADAITASLTAPPAPQPAPPAAPGAAGA
jgi:hypothetical protein